MAKLQVEQRFESIDTMHELIRHLKAIIKDAKMEEIETINIDANNKLITAVFNFDKEE